MPRTALHRSGLLLACLAACAIGASAVVACGSFDAKESASDAAASEASPADASLGDGDGDGGGAESCAPGAFCDSFDDDAAFPRSWTVMKQEGDASLNLVPGVGLNGSGGLVATVAPDGVPQSARLQLEVPAQGMPAYDAVLAFSAQASITTNGVVLGPRFVVNGPAGAQRGLSVTFKKGLVRLDPDTCDAGDCVLPKDEIPVAAGWHRYVLKLAVRPTTGANGSTYELDIDGTRAISKALPLLLSRPASFVFLFGVSYSGGTAAGTITFDDASLLVTAAQ